MSELHAICGNVYPLAQCIGAQQCANLQRIKRECYEPLYLSEMVMTIYTAPWYGSKCFGFEQFKTL